MSSIENNSSSGFNLWYQELYKYMITYLCRENKKRATLMCSCFVKYILKIIYSFSSTLRVVLQRFLLNQVPKARAVATALAPRDRPNARLMMSSAIPICFSHIALKVLVLQRLQAF